MIRLRLWKVSHATNAELKTRARTILVASACGVLAFAMPLRPADPVPAVLDKDAAFRATANQLGTNRAAPVGAAALRMAASNLVTVLNPDVTQVTMRQSPAFRQSEALATGSFLNPAAGHSQRMQDPVFREKYQAAIGAFSEAARRAKRPIPPSATDSNVIEALRADPAWRQQRETPVRLLLPHPSSP